MVHPHLAVLIALLCAGIGACAEGEGANARDASRLPAYGSDASGLFDDSLSRAVFGLPRGGLPLIDDPDFSRRTLLADSVSVMKVITITSDNNGDRPKYHLVLRPQGKALAGASLPPDPIDVDVGENDPAVALLHASGDNLSGSSLIVFLKHYKDRGQKVAHFHAEPDSKEVREAVASANRQKTRD